MTTAAGISHHIVFILAPSWGHTRPSVPFFFKIVQEDPNVVISIPAIGKFKDIMDKQVERYCNGVNSVLKDNIRIIQLSDFNGPEFEGWSCMRTLWPDFFVKAWECQPISCFTGRIYPSAPRPSLCVIDPMVVSSFGANLASEKKLKVLSWGANGVASSLSMLAPPEYGGKGNIEQEAKELAESKNISLDEAMGELFRNPGSSRKVRKGRGLPPAYDYEFTGEYNPIPKTNLADAVKASLMFRQNCDGTVLVNSPIIEQETIKVFRQWWCDSLGKTCYTVGPTPHQVLFDDNPDEFARGQEVRHFLDKIYKSHGKHSLLYMSLGTSSFPSGDTPWQLISIILDMSIPLVFAMPHDESYENQLPDDLRNRLESSELTLVAKWVSQLTILNHHVTGVFLTHGGQGSLTEALVAGVPLIVWPLLADQPSNCMNLTMNLRVAYQLYEVRIKHGLLPLYRGIQPTGTKEAIDREFRQVLKDAFGEDGEVKRRIAEDLSEKLKEEWKEGGGALNEMRRMLKENL